MSFLPAQGANAKTFNDVPKSHPYHNIIDELSDASIINGYSKTNTFNPNAAITRGQVAALITRSMDLPKTVAAKDFNDVPKNHSNYKAIQAMQQAGIYVADSKGNLYPDKAITRAEMAKALVIAFDLKGSTDKQFSDVSKSHPYYSYINTLYVNEITTGSGGKFLPNESLNRGHFAVFMHRAMNMHKGNKEDDSVAPPTPAPMPEPTPNPVTPTETKSYKNCTELKKDFPNGVKEGHWAYQSKMDRDGDGYACE